ncbi:unnamed protein product [Rotaria socialis]
MRDSNTHHVSTNIPSARLMTQKTLSNDKRPIVTTSSRITHPDPIDYIALDTFRRETIHKEEEAHRVWKAKFDPWLIDEYREMYVNRAKLRGVPPKNSLISLKRSEWQQPVDTLPPIHKRLPGQRRRRVLGSFPQTESDKIGWRLLPEHAIDKYGSKTAHIPPLPQQYKFSSWPIFELDTKIFVIKKDIYFRLIMGHKASKQKKDLTNLSEDEIERLTKNTTYSKQQIHDWHQGFLRDCPTGKLDSKKFLEVYKKFYPEGKAEKFCSQVFKTFDADGNGYIDFVEFLIAVNITSHGDVREKLRLAFDMYDMNKNGKIDKKEMTKVITAIYDLLGEEHRKGENSPENRVKIIMAVLDLNDDKHISRDEFVEGCLKDEVLRQLLAPNV